MAKAEADMERDARVVSLLEDNVRTELQVGNGMLESGLSDAAIEGLMEGVTSGLRGRATLLRALQTLLEPRLATAPGRDARHERATPNRGGQPR
ncbi:MAG: hypothetical protein QOG10_7187 [Kribbellaceae bacterium]|nr:hypothetical protein [Kribbellaceae bacterium]